MAIATSTLEARAQCFGEFRETLVEDGQDLQWYGEAVVLHGDWAFVAAPIHEANGVDSGAVFVYRLLPGGGSKWAFEEKLLPSDPSGFKMFGSSLAAQGGFLFVGAKHDNSLTGSVYVFEENGNGWQERGKLLPSDGGGGDAFGFSVDADGANVVVGAVGNGPHGAAYLFERTGSFFSETAKLAPGAGSSVVNYGRQVGIRNDHALISAPGTGTGAGDPGSVFVYERLTGSVWTNVFTITPSPATPNRFGVALDLPEDDLVFVGAPQDDDRGLDAGAVYVYERSVFGTWSLRQKIYGAGSQITAQFGNSLDSDGTDVVVGAYGDDEGGSNAGAVHLLQLEQGQWVEKAKMIQPALESGAILGTDVSIDGGWILGGARGSRVGGFANSGNASLFRNLSGLTLYAPEPGTAGEINTLTSVCGTPNETLLFVYGLDPGATPVPGCAGVNLGIGGTVRTITSIVVDPEGMAAGSGFVPATAQGTRVYLHAVELSACRVSNLVVWEFQ